MPRILHIESATYRSSIALSHDENLIHEIRLEDDGRSHAASMAVAIQNVLSIEEAGNLNAIALSKGPGSYTGLRIGASLAQGLCTGFGIPLIAIDSLTIAAHGLKGVNDQFDIYVPLIDARRMEVYTASFDTQLNLLDRIRPEVVDENTFCGENLCFGGNGAEKIKTLYPQHSFIDQEVLWASNMIVPALAKFNKADFEDLIEFKPLYVKNFVAGQPSKKILDILGLG